MNRIVALLFLLSPLPSLPAATEVTYHDAQDDATPYDFIDFIATVSTGDSATQSGQLSGNIFTKQGGGTLTLAAINVYSGATTVSDGTLRIDRGGSIGDPEMLAIQTHLWLDGNFEIADGSAAFRNIYAGATLGKNAEIHITGASSFLYAAYNLFLGYANNSTGELVLRDGGRVNTRGNTVLGLGAASQGVLTITGVSPDDHPAMLNTAELRVGQQGECEVVIEDGGSAVTTSVTIGNWFGSSGSISVGGVASTGTASSLIVNGTLHVGLFGDGSLEIKDGARAIADFINIGATETIEAPPAEPSTGTVLVTGAGSVLESNNGIMIGALSAGFLTVENGAEFVVHNGRIDLTAVASEHIDPEYPPEPLPDYTAGYAVLSIGAAANEATGAGIIDASEIRGGDGFATLVFNHTGTDYHLTRNGTAAGAAVRITGSVAVYHVAGVTTLSGANTYTGGTMLLGGRLILGHSSALGTGPLGLAGGILDLNGFSATLGEFDLLVGGTIDFGADHAAPVTLSFADSSGGMWLGELTLLNFTVGADRLNFSSVGGLTSEQLALIRLAGYEATGLDALGNVLFTSAIPEPSVFAALAGLVGLAAACRRRLR